MAWGLVFKYNDTPEKASRPLDNRDGFVFLAAAVHSFEDYDEAVAAQKSTRLFLGAGLVTETTWSLQTVSGLRSNGTRTKDAKLNPRTSITSIYTALLRL